MIIYKNLQYLLAIFLGYCQLLVNLSFVTAFVIPLAFEFKVAFLFVAASEAIIDIGFEVSVTVTFSLIMPAVTEDFHVKSQFILVFFQPQKQSFSTFIPSLYVISIICISS